MKLVHGAFFVLLVSCGQGAEPGPTTTPVATLEQLMDPETCKDCHPNQYREWSGSMHAYASDDPLFIAMNKRGQETAGIGDFCVKCHAPMAVNQGLPTDSAALAGLEKKFRGVGCYFCHGIDQVNDDHNNPLHLAGDGVMRAQLSDPVPNKAHHSQYSVLHDGVRLESATMCGSCHDIVNDHGAHLERTFAEWRDTVFAKQYGNTCSQCHMLSRKNDLAAEGPNAPGVFSRTVHNHMFPGVDRALTEWPETAAQADAVQTFLDTTLQTALCVRGLGVAAPAVQVIADNVAAGHKWPSGAAQDRRAWFEVTAYKDGAPIYQSGVVPPGTEPTSLADPDLWLLRDCLLDGQDRQVHMFWEAASYDSNLLPTLSTFDPLQQGFYMTHQLQTFPRSGASGLAADPDRVTLRVWLQPFPYDVFDDLFADPGSNGLTEAQVAAMRAKLAPLNVGVQPELEWTLDAAMDPKRGGQFYVDETTRLPVWCVTNNGLNAASAKVTAPKHMKCSP